MSLSRGSPLAPGKSPGSCLPWWGGGVGWSHFSQGVGGHCLSPAVPACPGVPRLVPGVGGLYLPPCPHPRGTDCSQGSHLPQRRGGEKVPTCPRGWMEVPVCTWGWWWSMTSPPPRGSSAAPGIGGPHASPGDPHMSQGVEVSGPRWSPLGAPSAHGSGGVPLPWGRSRLATEGPCLPQGATIHPLCLSPGVPAGKDL